MFVSMCACVFMCVPTSIIFSSLLRKCGLLSSRHWFGVWCNDMCAGEAGAYTQSRHRGIRDAYIQKREMPVLL